MGMTYAEIELINADDLAMVRRFVIGEEEIRSMHVHMLVDTGSEYMCINETVQEQLGLSIVERRKFQLANGNVEEFEMAGPIELRFKNRRFLTEAVVLPGNNEPLLGAISMEGMDVLVHPSRHELVVNPEHPNVAQMRLKVVQ